MQLREALDQIAEIRQRMAESETFRGYRSLPVAASGLLAILGGWVQGFLVPEPSRDPTAYVAFWSVIAVMSLAMAGITMLLRDYLLGASGTRAVTLIALRQICPALATAAALTLILLRADPECCWMLPALWQLFFGQGTFASCRILPRSAYSVAGFFMLSGLATLALARGEFAFSPWAMAVPFGLGQFLSAAVLYYSLERHHVEV